MQRTNDKCGRTVAGKALNVSELKENKKQKVSILYVGLQK
jgi:hypothetical protein